MTHWIEVAQAWARNDCDEETAAQALALAARGDEQELAAHFDGALVFGTAGLRAEVGRMPAGERALAPAGRRAQGLNDVCLAHRIWILCVRDGRRMASRRRLMRCCGVDRRLAMDLAAALDRARQ